MKINEIITDDDYIFERVECSFIVESKKIANEDKDGFITTDIRGVFIYNSNHRKYKFEFKNNIDEARILDMMKQGFDNLVSIEKNDGFKFYIKVYFFPIKERINQFNIVMSKKFMMSLEKNKITVSKNNDLPYENVKKEKEKEKEK